MQIEYNSTDKALLIKDYLKVQYFLIYLLIAFNILNAVLNLYDIGETGIGLMELVWLTVGVISFCALFFFIIRKSSINKIPISKIKGLKETSIFGKRRFSLELKNGKKRDLIDFKTQKELDELQNLLSEIGI